MGVPYIIEKDGKGREKAYDLYSRLLKDRIIFITGEFNQQMSDSVVPQLLFLESESKEKDICIYINSPGGSLSSMYAIYDTMSYIAPDIVTIGYGMVMSAGSFILAAGTKGKRSVLPNTEIMFHELSTGTQGKARDIFNYVDNTRRVHEKMFKQYAEFTGQSVETIKEDALRDFYLDAASAVKYGIVDSVQERRV